MEIWQQVLTLTLTPTMVVALLAYLGKGLLDTQIRKDLAAFKAGLDSQINRDLAAFKTSLNQALFEHQTRYSILREKQALVIGELYSKIAHVSSRLAGMIHIFQPGGVNVQERISEVASLAQDMQDYFSQHEIYFDDSTCTMIDQMNGVLHSVYTSFSVSQTGETYGPDESGLWRGANKEFKEKCVPLKQELRREFRAILLGESSRGI